MAESLEERLVRIESSLAHLENLYEQLNQVVVEHGKQLARLQVQQQKVAAALEGQERERIEAATTRPPHYEAR